MSFYNKILEKVILPAGDAALGTEYIKHLKYWRKLQLKSADELASLQRDNLQKLLEHATINVPYFRDLNIRKEDDPYLWLKNFPQLTKRLIKDNIDGIVLGDKTKLHVEKSSGSSGFQGTVYMTKTEASYTQAIQTLWWEWAGYKFGNSLMQTGISPNRGLIKRAKDILLRTDYVPAFNIPEEFAVKKLREMEKSPKDHFGGYASSLYVFAKTAKEHNITGVRFKSVFSWGDKMFPHFRKLIEEQFQTKVFDSYGCTEGLMMAAQNDFEEYYIMTPHIHLEILDKEGNEVPDGELGYVVVTRLDCYTMPMIRYYLGDLAIKSPEKPGNGHKLGFPTLTKIIGRDTDIIKTASGKYMVVHSFTGIFEHIPEIKQFRVIQRVYEEIEIEIIPDNGYNDTHMDFIRGKIHGYLKEEFPVHIRIVDFIPDTASGKPQIIQSFIK